MLLVFVTSGCHNKSEIERLCFNVDTIVKGPLVFTWAFPEFNHVFMMPKKEFSKAIKNKGHLFLKRVR